WSSNVCSSDLPDSATYSRSAALRTHARARNRRAERTGGDLPALFPRWIGMNNERASTVEFLLRISQHFAAPGLNVKDVRSAMLRGLSQGPTDLLKSGWILGRTSWM